MARNLLFGKASFVVLLALALAPFSTAFGETRSFQHEYGYKACEADSRLTARTIALEQVKRLLLQELGTYLEIQFEIKNMELSSSQIAAYLAGIVKTEIVYEKWDGELYWLHAKIDADPGHVLKVLDTLRKDKQKTKDLEDARQEAQGLLKELERMRTGFAAAKDAAAKLELSKRYHEAAQQLNAADWFNKGHAAYEAKDGNEANTRYAKPRELNLAAEMLPLASQYEVTVFYGTDRLEENPANPREHYGSRRGKGLQLGSCVVTIPKDHKMGEMESPGWISATWDTSKHIVLGHITEMDEKKFIERFRASLANAPSKEVVVFIHGYANSFEDAARRTAQMAYDLKYGGIPSFFSWPSRGGMAGYTADENNVEWAIPHLEEFLALIAQRTGAVKVHVIAHSMGNRLLTRTLMALEQRKSKPHFHNIILAAPDIDAQVFVRDIVPRIKGAGHITVYTNPGDQALSTSESIHGEYPRVGQGGDELTKASDIDMDIVNAEAVDTSLLKHSYIAGSSSVIGDVYLLIKEGKQSPKERCLSPEGAAWRLAPDKQQPCIPPLLR